MDESYDLSTEEGMIRFAREKRNAIEKMWKLHNKLIFPHGISFMHWLISKDPVQGTHAIPFAPSHLRRVNPMQRTEAVAEYIVSIREKYHLIGVLHATEMWFTLQEPGLGYKYGDARRDPKRGEGLLVRLEMAYAQSIQWVAVIKRNPNRLEAWSEDRYPEHENVIMEGLLMR